MKKLIIALVVVALFGGVLAAQEGSYSNAMLGMKTIWESFFVFRDGSTTVTGTIVGDQGAEKLSLDPAGRITSEKFKYTVKEYANEAAFLADTDVGDLVLVSFTNPTN